MEFMIDGDTEVEGKLEVDSPAKVEYCSADGRNVAVYVIVTPSPGKGAR